MTIESSEQLIYCKYITIRFFQGTIYHFVVVYNSLEQEEELSRSTNIKHHFSNVFRTLLLHHGTRHFKINTFPAQWSGIFHRERPENLSNNASFTRKNTLSISVTS